jgi:plastocyanin
VRPNKGKKFGTNELPRGKSYSYTFKKPGTYAYYCTFHGSPGGGQHGTIVVTPAPTTTTTGLLDRKSG